MKEREYKGWEIIKLQKMCKKPTPLEVGDSADMLIVLGWCFSRKELIDLFTSNEKVWCVEE